MKTQKFNKKEIMTLAWVIRRTTGVSLSEALKASWAKAKGVTTTDSNSNSNNNNNNNISESDMKKLENLLTPEEWYKEYYFKGDDIATIYCMEAIQRVVEKKQKPFAAVFGFAWKMCHLAKAIPSESDACFNNLACFIRKTTGKELSLKFVRDAIWNEAKLNGMVNKIGEYLY